MRPVKTDGQSICRITAIQIVANDLIFSSITNVKIAACDIQFYTDRFIQS